MIAKFLYGSQTPANTRPVHALRISRGSLRMSKRSKQWKKARQCEGMRLKREFITGGWDNRPKSPDGSEGPTLAERCEEAADVWLGVAQGSRDAELRADTPPMESPCGFDITALGRVEYMAC